MSSAYRKVSENVSENVKWKCQLVKMSIADWLSYPSPLYIYIGFGLKAFDQQVFTKQFCDISSHSKLNQFQFFEIQDLNLLFSSNKFNLKSGIHAPLGPRTARCELVRYYWCGAVRIFENFVVLVRDRVKFNFQVNLVPVRLSILSVLSNILPLSPLAVVLVVVTLQNLVVVVH